MPLTVSYNDNHNIGSHWHRIGGNRMGELADRLKTVSKKALAPCPVGKLLDSLDAETKVALESALASRATTRSIHRELTSSGIQIGRDTLTTHRDGWCRCRAGEE